MWCIWKEEEGWIQFLGQEMWCKVITWKTEVCVESQLQHVVKKYDGRATWADLSQENDKLRS